MARSLVRWWAFSNPSAITLPHPRYRHHLLKIHQTHKPFFSFFSPSSTTKSFSISTASSSNNNNNTSGSIEINYLRLTDEELMSQCDMGTFKASGPGGQHRNKRESAVRLKHLPTGIIAQAVEDRSQHKNRASAVARLRTLLALKGNASFTGSDFCCRRLNIRSSTNLGAKHRGLIKIDII